MYSHINEFEVGVTANDSTGIFSGNEQQMV